MIPSPEAILAWLEAMTHDPLGLAVALALATLVTEDGALVAGSLWWAVTWRHPGL